MVWCALQDIDVLEINLFDAFGGKATEFLALEQVIAAFAALAVSSCGNGGLICGSIVAGFLGGL